MTPNDLDEVAMIEKECFNSQAWSRDAFSDALTKDIYLYYVAVRDEHVIGTAGLIISFDEATITNVGVKNEMRRCGVAKKLLAALIEIGTKNGINHFFLEVREGNVPARRLYESLNFNMAGKRKAFYKNPDEDAIVYVLSV